MINRVVLEGHLGSTPQRYETPSNKIYTYISLPLANPYKRENEDTEWMQCQVWNKTAEYILTNAVVGDLITVDGRLRNTKYTNKKTGNIEYRTYVQIERLTLHKTGKRENGNKTNYSSNQTTNQPNSFNPSNTPNNQNSFPSSFKQPNNYNQTPFVTTNTTELEIDENILNQQFDPFSDVFSEDEEFSKS